MKMPMQGMLGKFYLKFLTPLAQVRHLPLVGPLTRRVSSLILPHDSRVWIQVAGGAAKDLWLRVNPRTGNDNYMGTIEPEVQEALLDHLRPGDVFYDIGANIGFFTLVGSRLVGPGGRVLAFEAEPEALVCLREHLVRNGCANAEVKNAAVCSASGTVEFLRCDPSISPDRGLGRVVTEESAGERIPVPAVALDDVIETRPAPDFVKCDAEGAEVEVFRGARRLLREKRPKILCEIHSQENGRLLGEMLGNLGYRLSRCSKTHLLAIPQ
jgi:FkbM family methyltransferase